MAAARSPTALVAVVVLVALAIPVLSLDTGMPSIKVVPEGDTSRQGYEQVQAAFGAGAPGAAADRRPARPSAARGRRGRGRDPGIAQVMPAQPGLGRALA